MPKVSNDAANPGETGLTDARVGAPLVPCSSDDSQPGQAFLPILDSRSNGRPDGVSQHKVAAADLELGRLGGPDDG